MKEIAGSQIKVKYIVAVILMLFFVLNDLVFDFVFNFGSSDYISFICTFIAAVIVFYCNYTIKKNKITSEFESAEAFIKSNFDNWQVAFSILDIICGAISILSGLAFLGAIFKVIKVGYVPIKIVVVTNKGKSIVKAATKVSLLWTSGRLLSEQNENRENKGMFKKIGVAIKNVALWIYSNKKSILGTLAAIASGVTTAIAFHSDIIAFIPSLFVFGFDVTPYLAGLVIFGLTELGVTGKGFETIKEFFARIKANKEQKAAEKAVKAEQKQNVEAEKAKKVEEKKQADENKKAEKLLKKLEAEEKALREKKAIADAKKAEEERLLQKALALKAEREKSNIQN